MDIEQNGVSGHVTPAESNTESSKRDDTPESTEVTATLPISFKTYILMI
jgi:hypothetical protein